MSGPLPSGQPLPGGPQPARCDRVLVARLDSLGDVLISGPAVRAVAASAGRVALLCGPRGRAAAELLPGVGPVLEWHAPWIDFEPGPVTPDAVRPLLRQVQGFAPDAALILTSFHQSPLPLALLLRLAGVPWIGAICHDYPGSLLDLRHQLSEDAGLAEPERALSLAAAAGFTLPPGDDGSLQLSAPLPDVRPITGPGPYVCVHPGTAAPARAWPPARHAEAVRALAAAGHRVLVTGTPGERELTAQVAGSEATNLGGQTTLAELAAVFSAAGAVVAGNTGPAHLAASAGVPVVSLFAPTVPAHRWAPYGVPVALLGDQHAACAGSRARVCPVPGHPCLSQVTGADVAAAVHLLAGQPQRSAQAQRPSQAQRPPGTPLPIPASAGTETVR
jgi:ADP-heptose:LPS heptosyltransferase